MALFGDATRGLGGAGPYLLAGAGALILGRPLLRLAGRATRPLARTVIRTVIRSWVTAREGLEEIVEQSRTEVEEAAGARGARPSRSPRARVIPTRRGRAPGATV